mmetsp:Transcript_64783/g.208635  ORF Transcript_64783/g.208635 Transcript_64783/m.208635 type:complete len:323 (-) Transcript_64783:265-1233(-)
MVLLCQEPGAPDLTVLAAVAAVVRLSYAQLEPRGLQLSRLLQLPVEDPAGGEVAAPDVAPDEARARQVCSMQPGALQSGPLEGSTTSKHAREVCLLQVCAHTDCRGKVGFNELSAPQVCAHHARAHKPCSPEDQPWCHRAVQACLAEVSTSEVRSPQASVLQLGAAEVRGLCFGVLEDRPPEVSPSRPAMLELCPSEVCACEPRPLQAAARQFCLPQAGLLHLRTAEVNASGPGAPQDGGPQVAAEVRPAERGAREVGARAARTGQARVIEHCSPEPCAFEVRRLEPCLLELRLQKACACHVRSSELRPLEERRVELGAAEI